MQDRIDTYKTVLIWDRCGKEWMKDMMDEEEDGCGTGVCSYAGQQYAGQKDAGQKDAGQEDAG